MQSIVKYKISLLEPRQKTTQRPNQSML